MLMEYVVSKGEANPHQRLMPVGLPRILMGAENHVNVVIRYAAAPDTSVRFEYDDGS